MTEHDQQAADRTDEVPVPRGPVPDLGFFAGSPPPRDGGGPFGGAPSQFGGAPSQFGGAPSQFGTAPAPFGSPGPAFPAPPAPPPVGAPRAGGASSTVKLVVGGVAVVLLLVAVFGGRFAWQQFVADPVAPDTLMGMPRIAGASDALLRGAQDGLTSELSSGSAVEVALYTNGQGSGYMLFAVRGGSRPGSGDSSDPLNGWTESERDGVSCFSKPAQVAAGIGVTMCMKGFWRRGVIVMGMGLTPPDPGVVARATNEAWDAQ